LGERDRRESGGIQPGRFTALGGDRIQTFSVIGKFFRDTLNDSVAGPGNRIGVFIA